MFLDKKPYNHSGTVKNFYDYFLTQKLFSDTKKTTKIHFFGKKTTYFHLLTLCHEVNFRSLQHLSGKKGRKTVFVNHEV